MLFNHAITTKGRFFHLVVAAVGLSLLTTTVHAASVTLAWDPPTENTDGTPLTDLVAYNVYYGQATRSYPWKVPVESIPEATITDLADGTTYYFAVTAVNSAGIESDFSEELVWTASDPGTAPSIVAQPQNATVVAPAEASFTVGAAGSAPLGYQWRRNGVAIAGATGPKYTLATTSAADDGMRFDVVVSNPYGSVTSAVAWLTVRVSPSILTQPQSVTVREGKPVTFTVVAVGENPLSYQWRRDGLPIPSAESSSFTIARASMEDNGSRFDVVVQNAVGIVTSDVAVLRVEQKVVNRRVKLTWEPVEGATMYYLWVKRNGKVYQRQWVAASQTQWEPDHDLPAGAYVWRVSGWNPTTGQMGWSDAQSFFIPVAIPSRIAQIYPCGSVPTNRPTFVWIEDEGATRYELRLNRGGSTYLKARVEADTQLLSPRELAVGLYKWWVRGWSPDGFGPWSTGMEFSYGIPEPVCPAGVVSDTRSPEFVWNDPAADTGRRYCLQVTRNGRKYRTIWVEGGTSWVMDRELLPGNYAWWVRTWSSSGYGPWSRRVNFVIPFP
ncbi:MAG: immunoglobulin domain-containing protein [Kiritimatiellae bacterium]|nr:immunoglobulin domain-containing protein [Kiritimatiellia bacterium]